MLKNDTLLKAYDYLEKKPFCDSVEILSIEKRFQNLHSKYRKQKYKDFSKWESLVWAFRISNGKIEPMWSTTSKEGKIITEYPSLKDLDSNNILYLKKRSCSVKNDFLKSRYNHILWESRYKHKNYAINAIDSYLRLVEESISSIKSHQLLHLFKCTIKLSYNSKYKISETNSQIKNLIQLNVLEDYHMLELGTFYLENYTKESTEILSYIFSVGMEKLDSISRDSVYYPEFCNKINLIGKKLKRNIIPIQHKKAEYYVELANNEGSWVKQDHYFNAIQVYLEIGAKEKADELYVLIENSKEDIRLGAFKKEFDGKEIQAIFKNLHERTEKLTDLESEEIYDYLALSSSIIPKAEVFHKKSKKTFLDILNTTSFDINSNFSKSEGGNSISEYWLHISNFTIRELSWIFQKGIIKGTIDYDTIIQYLHKKSWIGKIYSENDYDGKPHEYCWLNLIAPALYDFFNLSEALLNRKVYGNTGYVLCIDSLTLKIEGLIRHFAKLIQCPTIIINKKKNGTRERYIEEIISHEKFKSYFPEEDIVFIFYLMTNKGMNIRNNIAHSFYRYENYSPTIMYLLISVLLRLSKFDLNFKRK